MVVLAPTARRKNYLFAEGASVNISGKLQTFLMCAKRLVNNTFFVKGSVFLCSKEKSSISFANIRGAATGATEFINNVVSTY